MIVLAEGFDVGNLMQVAVVFAIFVLPVLRNIVQARQKQRVQREKLQRGELKAPPDKKAKRKGLSDWERLLRGEPVERSAGDRPKPPVILEQLFPELVEDEPPPHPAPRPTPAQPAPRARVADQSMEVDFEGSLRQRAPRPELEAAFAGLGETDLTTLDDRPLLRKRPPARTRPRLDWRRAVALSEVLGQPVSMRESGAWPGAPRGL